MSHESDRPEHRVGQTAMVRNSFRMPQRMDQAIDTAVEGGLWTDRSEFIRGAIRQQLQREFRGDDS